ncbi:MAG: TRAP transporter substrate-binding protein DctP [Gammaproteobacteria bacterium]|nr:TRAP transporter substrate-binding protein DctP [Gammaproteobacteria bacterium]
MRLNIRVAIIATWVTFMFAACAPNETSVSPGDASSTEATSGFPAVTWDASLWSNRREGTVAVDTLAELLSERTEGAWQLNVHYGEALSKARENLDGIAIGAFEVAMVCNFYHPRKNPALMVLTMPFLPIESDEDSKAVRKAVYSHPAVVEEFARWDAMIYTSTYLPQYEFMGRGTPPKSTDDWRGMTVRAGGGIGDAMQLLGATPTSSTATEVYTGVQQGTMNAAAFPFTYAFVSYRIHEVSDWFTNGMAPGTADCPVVFRKTAYDALPPKYQALLEEIKDDVDATQLQAYRDFDKVNLPMLRDAITEVVFTSDMRDELRESVGRRVIEAWIAENEEDFDARGLVELAFEAAGAKYE